MARPRKDANDRIRKRPPATTPEAQENYMISLAIGLAERQLIEGTASPTVVNHYLKLGSSRESREQKRLELQTELLKAQADSIASTQRVEEMYTKALSAMREYQGVDNPDDFTPL